MQKSDAEKRLLETACLQYDVDPEIVDKLLDLVQESEGRLRRRGLRGQLKDAIGDYVAETEEDVLP